MDHGSKKLARVVLALAALACLLALFCFSGNRVTALRRQAQHDYVSLTETDLPAQIESSSIDGRVIAIRRPVNKKAVSPALSEALRFIGDSPHIVAVADSPRTGRRRVLTPLVNLEGSGLAALSAPLALEFGEAFDESGKPLRWQVPENALSAYNVPRQWPFAQPEPRPAASPGLAAALAKLAPSGRARDYRALVDSFAKRYNLNTSLVMAIIHSESNFSPGLVSSKSAMGLMQLLPSTASDEVHRFLYGRRGQVNFEQLSVPEINIRYGTAYLHILNNRYFADVKDASIREACVIASYNMGPNGFLRLYGPTPGQAIGKINSMSAEEFHADLPRRLPVRETRFYVEKVRRMKQHYAGMP